MKRSLFHILIAVTLVSLMGCGVLLSNNLALRRSLDAAREAAAQLQERVQALEGSPYSE